MKRTWQWPREWGPWDEFTQYRRPDPTRVEFRRTIPAALVLGLVILVAALDIAFVGILVPGRDLGIAAVVAVIGILVFLSGRGLVLDGPGRLVRRWWGWIFRPVVSRNLDVSAIRAVQIDKRLGPTDPDPAVGRDVLYPVALRTQSGRSIVVKPCPWVSEARFLAEGIAPLIGVAVIDESGEPEDMDETEY